MAEATGKKVVTLEREELSDESDDDFNYEEVSIGDSDSEDADEDFETALQNLRRTKEKGDHSATTSKPARASLDPEVKLLPTVIDDFIRNFSSSMGCASPSTYSTRSGMR